MFSSLLCWTSLIIELWIHLVLLEGNEILENVKKIRYKNESI